jgi:glyceraldehyde-3-phosphate dehydrogenase/erythrose-4-phosphate dehydrogenase
MTTVHAYTDDQMLLDGPHTGGNDLGILSDLMRSRS